VLSIRVWPSNSWTGRHPCDAEHAQLNQSAAQDGIDPEDMRRAGGMDRARQPFATGHRFGSLPEDAILVADTGYSGIWTSTLVDLNGVGQTYLRAAGSLGWAFPGSLGAKCAAPGRKVVCFSGDGALYYHLTELETAKRRGIAVTLIVNNNSGFGQGWPNLVRMQGNKPGDPAEMLRFGPTDFAAIARGFGIRSIRVEDPAKIGAALREAVATDETVADIEARAPEPWLPAGAG
jgi:acetolactate synthase-1/2/3 large subunit